MGVIGGVGGCVDGIPGVMGWQIQSSAESNPYHASNTRKGTGRVAGNIDWSGQYSALGHTPAKMPGDIFTFVGSIDGSKGVSGQCICNESEVTIDIEGGRVIEHVVRFGAKGVLNKADTTSVSDTTVPNPPPSIGCKVQTAPVAASPSFTEETDVRTVTIVFTQNQPTYTSSSSAGVTQRVAANLDVTVRYGRYVDDFSLMAAENAVKQVRCFVNATEFWDLRWMRASEASDLDVNVQDGTPVSGVTSWGMDGFAVITATPTVGFIKKPDGSTYWPV